MKTCGQCIHYNAFASEPRGECYFNPPSLDSRGVKVRPPVNQRERQCSHFVEGESTTATKVNPETPGAAAKAARTIKK